jgi:hypothetical protein
MSYSGGPRRVDSEVPAVPSTMRAAVLCARSAQQARVGGRWPT